MEVRLRIDRTSCVKRRASSMGSKSSRAVSYGSENHDLMGMALSESEREREREREGGREGGRRESSVLLTHSLARTIN